MRREQLGGNEPELQFTLKRATVLHRDQTTSPGLTSLQPRFQLTDRFDQEITADVSAPTHAGKTYVYTITPVDLAGNLSRRPYSIIARRLPADPPQVPTDGELVIEYQLADQLPADACAADARPTVVAPDVIAFQWSDPPPPSVPQSQQPPAVETYRLIFRRENALPIGFFGADSDTRGGRSAGFPVTNATTLRTDRVIEIKREDRFLGRITDENGDVLRSDSGRAVQQITLDRQQLIDKRILPAAGAAWRPEAWRVFVQSVTRRRGPDAEFDGVPSALAPVTIRLRWRPKASVPAAKVPASKKPPTNGTKDCTPVILSPLEERRFGLLEWLPLPIRFNLLPPEDQSLRGRLCTCAHARDSSRRARNR